VPLNAVEVKTFGSGAGGGVTTGCVGVTGLTTGEVGAGVMGETGAIGVMVTGWVGAMGSMGEIVIGGVTVTGAGVGMTGAGDGAMGSAVTGGLVPSNPSM